MGFYLNSRIPLGTYQKAVKNPYFVDKSSILSELNAVLGTEENYICITRPRRFGKSLAASMIGAYYSVGYDAEAVFSDANISKAKDYKSNLNSHNVIYIDFSKADDDCCCYRDYIDNIKELLREDLHFSYPQVPFRQEKGTVLEDFKRLYQETGQTFIFVMDEWDAIFHMDFIKPEDNKKYLLFLKTLLKDQPYVELAYMTGILPIAKYSSGSELNMFREYTMGTQHKFSGYFGFTESEVDGLYQKYLNNNKKPKVSRESLRFWYDGYQTVSGERLYNPRSVVLALENDQLADYWTNSGPYDEIYTCVRNNISAVQEDIALMIGGEEITADIKEYTAASRKMETRDEILSAMVVYGFLTGYGEKVRIPNKELMDKFSEMVKTKPSLGYVHRLAKESKRMLEATKAGDTDVMEKIIQIAHDTESSMTGYNSEAELSALIRLIYLEARDSYDIQREDKAGTGYVDYIFYPVTDKSADCIIIELKVNDTADAAIRQIKDRKYMQRFLGKLGETPNYTGRILAVGIAYDKTSSDKKHECKVEVLREKIC